MATELTVEELLEMLEAAQQQMDASLAAGDHETAARFAVTIGKLMLEVNSRTH